MKKYIKSKNYNQQFIAENIMGPNPIYLLEDICEHLNLNSGMRVLDMGCGKGLTSIFLAQEYGMTVYATDLWITATENYERFKSMGLDDKIIPIHSEAHDLPYADGFFDAAISIDSYHYYGANETYFPEHFARLVKKGGQFGIACPGMTKETNGIIPDTLKGIWEDEEDAFETFHSAKWWSDLWNKTSLADITSYGEIEDAKKIWYEWVKIAKERYKFNDQEILDADTEDYLTLVYMTAIKK